MNICCCIDEKFIEPFKVLCYSLAESQEEEIELYLIHDSLDEKKIKNIKKYLDFLKISFYEIPFPLEIKEKLSLLKETRKFKTPISALFRLFIPTLLPKNINRVLYLDSDIIVQKNILDFYYTAFLKRKIIGILDPINLLEYDGVARKYIREVLEIVDNQTYINSGVLLFNLEELRKTKDLNFEEIYKTINEKNLIYVDQDVINFLLKNDIFILKGYNYNAPIGSLNKEDIKDFSIIHYLGSERPWFSEKNWLTATESYPYIKRSKIIKLIENYLHKRENP